MISITVYFQTMLKILQLYLELAELVRAGDLYVDIEAQYPIEEIAQAAAHANRGQRTGKIVVLPNGDPNG